MVYSTSYILENYTKISSRDVETLAMEATVHKHVA